jgi:hypothetical protein
MKNGGQILEINYAIIYPKYDYVFNEFVDYFDKFRKRGGVFKLLGKLIVNSLYGKMGSGIKETEYVILNTRDEVENLVREREVVKISSLNKIHILEVKTNRKAEGINVGLAAAITSKARIKLLNTMLELEVRGGRMLYCDTDSVFLEFKNKVDKTMFNWESDDSIYDGAIFALPKTYALKKGDSSSVKIKGIPRSSISFEDFDKKFKTGELLTFIDLMHIRRRDFRIRYGEGDKRINLSSYDKRNFTPDMEDT